MNSHELQATARAKVVTARSRPRARRAGTPTSRETPAPRRPANGTVTQKGTPWASRAAAPNVPMPTTANWPSDSWPAHPVNTTTDSPTTAYSATLLRENSCDERPATSGTTTATANPAAIQGST